MMGSRNQGHFESSNQDIYKSANQAPNFYTIKNQNLQTKAVKQRNQG